MDQSRAVIHSSPIKAQTETEVAQLQSGLTYAVNRLAELVSRLSRFEAQLHGNNPETAPSKPEPVPDGLVGEIALSTRRARELVDDAHGLMASIERFA